MKTMIRKLWTNEDGFVVSMELILVATILVIGLVAGLGQLRDAVVAELVDVANAIGAADQTYGVGSVQNAAGTSDGSNGFSFADATDTTAGDGTIPVYTASGLTASVSASTQAASAEGAGGS